MYLCDTHTHTAISFDSKASLEDMTRAAAAAGLQELCVTDHCDLLDSDGQPSDCFGWAEAKAQYAAALSHLPSGLTLRLGIELGSIPYEPDRARRILSEGGDEVDFVLGSVHNWIGLRGNRDLYFTDYTDAPALCRQAMENALETTRSMIALCPDCFDSLAHITYPLRYMRRDGQEVSARMFEEQIRGVFTALARSGRALEVNTWRGLDVEPWLPLLKWFRQCGGEFVTLGSDAHAPEDMAKGIRQAAALLQAAGFDRVTTYEKRRPVLHKL